MQNVVFDEPYEFVSPYRGTSVSWAVGKFVPRLLRTKYGVMSWKTHGLDLLRESLKAKYGIILCPNHSRNSDPLLSGVIVTETPAHAYAMASWHVFKQHWLETLVCRGIGGFSIYREGLDRKALDLAVEVVSTAERPLLIFPEGVISAANDRLMPLMDGVSFVANTAAKRRAKIQPDSKVVIHPVAYKYEHLSDPETSLSPVLSRLEQQLFWRDNKHQPVRERINLLREAMQSLREIQVLGFAKTGNVEERIAELANHILQKHEQEWLGKTRTGDVIVRVKDIRIAVVTEMAKSKLDEAERQRRWRVLTDVYYVQCMSLHVRGYLDEGAAGDRYHHRLFETVERMEEELTDKVTLYHDLHVTLTVGEPIEVDPTAKKPRGSNPLMEELRRRMTKLLGIEDHWPPEPVVSQV